MEEPAPQTGARGQPRPGENTSPPLPPPPPPQPRVPLGRALLSPPRRACFPDLQRGYLVAWFVLDYTSDLLYLLDIAVHFHTGQ